MNKKQNKYLSAIRKMHHLKINDLAYLLGINQSNLSRFESGKISNLKALIGYHILLNLSIENSIRQVFKGGFKELYDRCFILSEKLSSAPKTNRNALRLEGLHTITTRLMEFEEKYV